MGLEKYMVMTEKLLYYEGKNPPDSVGKVLYIRHENIILFSGLDDARRVTSTVMAAGEIVANICLSENTGVNEVTFYDVRTPVGYPWLGDSFIAVDELILSFEGDSSGHLKWREVLYIDESQISSNSTDLDILILLKSLADSFGSSLSI
jgi:hypothetical protein